MTLNKVQLIGRLGRDPEVRQLGSGGRVVNLRLATSERWKDKQSGERKEKTEWHSVVIFNEQIGDIAERYLKKGSQCYVEGAIQTRKWQDQSGVEKYSTEIVLQKFRGELKLMGDGGSSSNDNDLDAPGLTNGRGGPTQQEQQRQHAERKPAAALSGSRYDDLDDDIPF